MLNRKTEKYPRVRSYIDFLTLSWEGSRATWKVLPQLTAFQVLVAAVGSYFTLWGRNRLTSACLLQNILYNSLRHISLSTFEGLHN